MIAWLLVGWLALAQADGAVDGGAIKARIATLLGDLESPQKIKRDAAEKGLVDLGIAVLEYLPRLDAAAPAEVRLRVNRVRNELERRAAEASVQGSLVTLQGNSLPLADVLKAFKQQTGNDVVDQREQFGQAPRNESLKVNFQRTSFWEALDQVLDQANLTVYGHSGEESLMLVGRSRSLVSRRQAAYYAGAFRIAPLTITARRDLRDAQGNTLQLDLEVAWEPRLRPILIVQPAAELRAEGDAGQIIKTVDAADVEINVNPGVKSLEVPLRLVNPGRDVRKLGMLSGQFNVVLPGKIESFEFKDLMTAKGVEQKRAAASVVLDRVSKNNELWEIRVRVVFEKAGQALESHRSWIFNNEAWLEGPNNQKIPYGALETTRQTETEIGFAYLFSVLDDLKDFKLVYRTPVSIFTLPVKYELKDIELP